MGTTNSTQRTGSAAPLVLCVDDEPLLREMMARVLRRSGAEVVTAADGGDALARLRAGLRPDLVLTDLVMPAVGGEALLRALRADPALAAIPVVAVSGTTTDAPFDDAVAKPFGPAELRQVLATFCPSPPVARCG